jgi:hypothetical protein
MPLIQRLLPPLQVCLEVQPHRRLRDINLQGEFGAHHRILDWRCFDACLRDQLDVQTALCPSQIPVNAPVLLSPLCALTFGELGFVAL